MELASAGFGGLKKQEWTWNRFGLAWWGVRDSTVVWEAKSRLLSLPCGVYPLLESDFVGRREGAEELCEPISFVR